MTTTTATNIKELSNEFGQWLVKETMDEFHNQLEDFLSHKFREKLVSGEMSYDEFRRIVGELKGVTNNSMMSFARLKKS